jgi:DNA-binding MarR family transcriptional regulator/L-amino acid N-acyltransferase YncA
MKNPSTKEINQLRHDARSVVRELGLLNDAYFEIGVTLAERHLLIELSACQCPTMGEIAERLLIDKSTVSRLISKAIKKGFVKCSSEGDDKRKKFLHLTEKGKNVLKAFEAIAFSQTQEALLTLTKEEIKTVYEGIALYAKGLKSSRFRNKMPRTYLTTQSDANRAAECNKKIESLPEISERLNQLGYILEPFDQKDEEGLYEIFQDVVDSGSQFPYECRSIQEFRRQFFNSNGRVYVCRSLAQEVIGGFYIRSNFPGRSSHIANAAYMIRNIYRGKGIGSLLVKASLHLAKGMGFQAMQFNMVLSQNTIAIKLYQKLGFNIIGTIPQAVRNPDGSYQDGYLMHRELED